jgi:hypothetical protein
MLHQWIERQSHAPFSSALYGMRAIIALDETATPVNAGGNVHRYVFR